MSGSFSFDIDNERSLVRMELRGFFSPEQIVEFDRQRRLAYRDLRCPPNQHVTLIDIREMQIQPQDAVSAFSNSIADPVTRSRRIAFVVARSLARLQVKRAAAARDAAYFVTVEEAEAWLLGENDIAA